MSDQESLFNDAADAVRSTPSASKLSFLEGLFATWLARTDGREKANAADRKKALGIAEKALSELAEPNEGGRQ